MEKSNLPLPLKKRTIGEAISGIRVGSSSSKLEKRTTLQLRKHSLTRDSSGRVLKERPSQFSGSYLKKRFGSYSSKKTGVPFSLKASKAVVTSLCDDGDFADACFPVFSEELDAVQESGRAKRGALSMKSKLLQLQERNRLILAKHQYPRTSSSVHHSHLNPDLTSAILMTPLILKMKTTGEEDTPRNDEQQSRLGEPCSTSPIYHELDPIDGHMSSPEQHTYQSISEVREEMARLQAQMSSGSTMPPYTEHNPLSNSLRLTELSARESQRTFYERGIAPQQSEPKQNRVKRSILSKFWVSRRSLLSSQEDATTGDDGKAVLTSITSISEDEITAPHLESGSASIAQPSLVYSTNSRKHSPKNATKTSSWNTCRSPPSMTEYRHNRCHGFHTKTDSSCGYSNARCSCGNRDGVGNSYDCHYGWKNEDEVENAGKTGSTAQNPLQSFAKRSTIIEGMRSKTKYAEEYQSSVEMADALTEYHWNIYQTGNTNCGRDDEFLEVPNKDTRSFRQDQMLTSHLLPVKLTPDETRASSVVGLLDTLDFYTLNMDTTFLHSRPASSSASFFRGSKMMPQSQFSSPSCGVRMAEMRAVRRKSESSLLVEPSAKTPPCSTIQTQSKQDEAWQPPDPTENSSPCVQTELNQMIRNMHTILEEDQSTENSTSCRQIPLLPQTEHGTGKHSGQMESTANHPALCGSDPSSTNVDDCRISEEALSSDSSSARNYEETSADQKRKGGSHTKQLSTDSKINGSRLKKPKPSKLGATASGGHMKPTSKSGACSPTLLAAEQSTSSSKTLQTETPNPKSPPLLFDNVDRTTDREAKPLMIRQAVVRQIESVSSAQDVVGLELLESPLSHLSLQPTPRLKSASCIPRTKNSPTSRTSHSSDEKPRNNNSLLRQDESLKKRIESSCDGKQLNQRMGTGLLTFSRSNTLDDTFKEKKQKKGKHLDSLLSDNSTSGSEMSIRSESTSNWAESETPDIMVDCALDLGSIDQTKCSPSEYHVSETSSLSSSLTSSNSNSSVFAVTESESDSPTTTTSSSTRDLELELESPSSSSAGSSSRMDTQCGSTTTIPQHDSVTKEGESSTKKQRRGKSQLPAPRTDANRCLERLERLRIETKQTKNEFHQKLRH